MATVIKASCHDCGDVQLGAGDLRVRRCAQMTESTYLFRCPECQLPVVKPADARVVELLVASGVRVEDWQLPAELLEPHLGAPISHDDLIDFHQLLARDDWFHALERETTGPAGHER
jgi:hypothetical protein